MDTKRCPRCGVTKLVSEFHSGGSSRGDGLSGHCVECHREVANESNRRLRAQVLAHLGGRCVDCGFDDPRALQVDHVNGGGVQESKTLGRWAMLKKALADTSGGYQLLCANDNMRKRKREGEHRGARIYVRGTAGRTDEKRCPSCNVTKPVSEWPSNRARSSGLGAYCMACIRAKVAVTLAARQEVISAVLGRVCVRCGEDDLDVLCVDHVDGGGSLERKTMSSLSAAFVAAVTAHPERYRVLCGNCNWIVRAEAGAAQSGGGQNRDVRTEPTERKVGPGRGSHPNTKAIGRWWQTASEQEKAAAKARIAERRRGTKLIDGRWVRPTD